MCGPRGGTQDGIWPLEKTNWGTLLSHNQMSCRCSLIRATVNYADLSYSIMTLFPVSRPNIGIGKGAILNAPLNSLNALVCSYVKCLECPTEHDGEHCSALICSYVTAVFCAFLAKKKSSASWCCVCIYFD